MKVSTFKIRDRLLHKNKFLDPVLPEDQERRIQTSVLNLQCKFDMFIEKFQKIMDLQIGNKMQNLHIGQTKSSFSFQQDCRDNFVIIDLPQFQNNKSKFNQLQVWIGQLSRRVLSASFNYYNTGKFTYEQSKVFASQSFLRNICLLADKYGMSSEQLKFIDKKMQQEIFPYLKSKYPMTNQKGSNKSLEKAIKQINNIQVLTNDFFYYTDIEFAFRENGRYDDLIMRLLNQIMNKVNEKSLMTKNNEQISNFKDFQSFMTNIFQKTYDENWINGKLIQEKKVTEKYIQKIFNQESINRQLNKKQLTEQIKNVKDEFQNQIKNQVGNQKYKFQVQEYTNFLIGRKISENTQPFSQDQIRSKCLIIKSPAVLRILSKWCEELWQKFSNQNYFIEKTEGIRMQKGNQINILYPLLKIKLKAQMKKEKQNIQKFMKEIQEINYDQQMLLLKNQLQSNSDLHIDKIERITGKFSWKVVNNLQNFIIVYLNRLIHGLTNVSKQCFKSVQKMSTWPYPPNLISFKIGDLMRCKFSSKQREVLKVFQQIQRINNEQPQKMKIIRIKNRLKLGTNDVLINVRFNNIITCQVQLAVDSKKTQFIKCSYNFSHYVYELQRSSFGPISEFCSIWKNSQNRSKQFKRLIQKQPPKKLKQILQNSVCYKKNQSHKLIQNDKPFICCQCGKAYYQNNYMKSHVKCSKCVYWKCAICQIQENKKAKNKQFFLADEALNSISQFQLSQKIPDYGVCIFIKKKPIQPIIFKCVHYYQKQYLFKPSQIQDKSQLFKQISSQKQTKKFLKLYVLFNIPPKIGLNYFQINQRLAIQQFIIPSYLEKCFKQQKQTISVLLEDLWKVDLRKVKATKQQKKCIKYIQFSSTELSQIQDFVSKDYINLDCLNLNINKIQNIQHILKFSKLQKLYISKNLIKQIPEKIYILTKLKQINFQQNKIKKLPQSIIRLKSLTSIRISKNKLQNLPQKFNQLQNLKQFVANNNNFEQFPYPLTKHKTLELIEICQNNMNKMPESMEQLGNLKELTLSKNSLSALPKQMENMKKIQKVNLSFNKFVQFDKSVKLWKSLVEINFAANEIKDLIIQQQIRYLPKFVKVHLNQNRIQQLNDSFQNFRLIQFVSLQDNKIIFLSQQCLYLNQLRQIDLSNNPIQKIHSDCFTKCKKLAKVILQTNITIQDKQHQSQSQKKIIQIQLNRTNNCFYEFPKAFAKLSGLQFVNIIKSNVKIIPQDIASMKKLKQLILNQNAIQIIPDSIGNLQQLKVLDLSINKIQTFNQCMFKLVNLSNLDVSHNRIEFLPDKFQSFQNLKTLNIEFNKLKQLPSSLQDFQNLEFKFENNPYQVLNFKYLKRQQAQTVEITNRKLRQIIGDKTQDKDQIKICNLNQNCFLSIPKIFFTFSNITIMNLSDNYLKQVPKEIQKWKNLTQLNLQNNLIQVLPQEIGTLTQLRILNLKCQNLKYIPKSINKLKLNTISLFGDKLDRIQNLSQISAKNVDFSNQNLSKISQKIGDINNVKKIIFQSNSLEQLPESIGKQTKLISINISDQKLKCLPQSIGSLANLQKLCVSNNLIIKIPDTIGKLINLQKLKINNNKLKQLPQTMKNLKNLNQIIIDNNQIQKLPSWIRQLEKLIHLSVKANKITQISVQICIQTISKLQLKDNLIKKIPKQIQNMTKLQQEMLILSGNPIQEIQAYDFVIQKGDWDTINWAKQWKDRKNIVN